MKRIALVMMLALVSAAPPARAPATRPTGRATSRPAPNQPVVDPLLDEAVAAVRNDAVAEFAQRVEPELAKAMADLKKASADNLANIVRLATLHEFSRFFGKVKFGDGNQEQRATLAWLVQQRELASALLLSAGELDPPDRVLDVLRLLREAHKDKVAQYPNLAASLCLVWDEPGKGSEDEARKSAQTPPRLFNYFTRAKLRSDVRTMPVEMLALLADLVISDAELAYVQERYGSAGSPASIYFDLPYDESATYDISGRDPDKGRTLPNLQHFGGNALDQAYYASQAGKALGVPTVIMRGIGVETTAVPAWIAYLKSSASGVSWEHDQGRRNDHDGWPGDTVEPRTGEIINEGDLTLIALVEQTRPADRLASAALAKSANMLPAEKQIAVYAKAVELSPGNRFAWDELGRLAAKNSLKPAEQKQVDDLYRRLLLRRAPEYALNWRLSMIKDRPPADQIAALKKIGEEFRSSPVLFGLARIELGNVYEQEKRYPEALAAYEDAIQRGSDMGPIAAMAMSHVDPLLHKTNELEKLAQVYETAFGITERIRPSAWARTTPFFMIGERYVYVLEELKQDSKAYGVRVQLNNVYKLGQGPGIGPGAR